VEKVEGCKGGDGCDFIGVGGRAVHGGQTRRRGGKRPFSLFLYFRHRLCVTSELVMLIDHSIDAAVKKSE
jgi:hypothetical protein